MIKIYRDEGAKAIFIEDANGAQFLNSLQAFEDGGNVSIKDKAKSTETVNFEIVSGAAYTEFVKQDGTAYGTDTADTINELNAVFSLTNGVQVPPVITSSTSIALTTGDTLNYELTATNGVGYEWENLPTGVLTVEGNVRKLIGGSTLSPGIYTPTMRAVNYSGPDSKTLTITVSDPPFSATKSVRFNDGSSTDDYASASASDLDAVLGRASNGSGESWTIGFWVKPTNNGGTRCILYAGSSDKNNGGGIQIALTAANKVRLRYGSLNNALQLVGQNALTHDVWQYVDIRYDGGTTGSSSADISDYYSRLTININGAAQTTNNSHTNFGWSSAVTVAVFEIGRFVNSLPLNGEKICQLAVFDSDSDATTAELYNSGSPFDLNTLTNGPTHWWKMGDGDTFPTLIDHADGGNTNMTLNNMTVADIVTDSP